MKEGRRKIGISLILQLRKVFQNRLQQNELWMMADMVLCIAHFRTKKKRPAFLICWSIRHILPIPSFFTSTSCHSHVVCFQTLAQFDTEDILVPGPLVMFAAISNSLPDFGEPLYHTFDVCTHINKFNPVRSCLKSYTQHALR